MVRVGVLGASGYTGAELLRLCATHPKFEVVMATADSQVGQRAAAVYPSLAAAYPDLVFGELDPDAVDGLDLLFLTLPHGSSGDLMPALREKVATIVDLGADHRLKDPSLYPTWYGEGHPHPELLDEFAFGIPELFRDDIARSSLVAAAGCYVTTAALALAPLIQAGFIAPDGIVVDAASGVSGAGKALKPTSHFGAANEDFAAYGLLNHRHTPEIEQATGARNLLFTPHLAPMTRGILATCYARPVDANATTDDAISALLAAYAGEPFVQVFEEPVSTKPTLGSNCVHLTARVDPRTGWVVVLGALDNLVKGASGQMIQCANITLGLPETAGLPLMGLYP